MTTNQIKGALVIGAVVLALVASMVLSQDNLESVVGTNHTVYDRALIVALGDLSGRVPNGAAIVASYNTPYIAYFSGHKPVTPYGVSGRQALVKFMKDNGYAYLVVFEGKSEVPELERLFSADGIKDLDTSFEKVKTYRTEYSKIHLYRLRA